MPLTRRCKLVQLRGLSSALTTLCRLSRCGHQEMETQSRDEHKHNKPDGCHGRNDAITGERGKPQQRPRSGPDA